IHGANDNPVAVLDTGDATEAGGVNNTTAGANATGNVLGNDTDPDSAGNGETQAVSEVNGLLVNVGAPVAGTHGTLTLNANGTYSYAIDNSDTAVQALRLSTQVLTDTFTYTVADAAGATSSTTLTITIHG